MEQFFPNLPSAAPDVRDELRWLRKNFYVLLEQSQRLQQRQVLSPDEAKKLFSADAIKTALEVTGSSPTKSTSLNVNNLLGRLAQPQYPFVEEVLELPPISSPLSQNGNLISFDEILYRFDGDPEPGLWKAQGAVGVTLQDSRANFLANYPADSYPLGTLFWILDWTVLYINVDNGGNHEWQYALGTYSDTLANIPTLGTEDENLLFNVTDYSHVLRWDGSSWQWGPGEIGSGYYGFFEVAPTTAGANAWQLCDGSSVNRLNSNGSVTSVTVPNVSTPRVIVGGTSSSAVAGATGSTGSTDLAPTTNLFQLDAGGSTAVTGFTNPHSHTAGTALPPSKQATMYYRR